MNRLAKIVRRADLFVRLFGKTTTGVSSLLIAATLTPSHATDLDAMSPVVSYQYFDSPAAAPIMSPVVSYQYFDWPGDGNVTFTASPNVSYYFNGPPQIVNHPASQLVRVGESATLSVVAEGTPPLSYQWRFNGQALPNTAGAAIALDNLQPGDSGIYSVVVSNASGSVASKDARVIVYQPPPNPAPAPLVLLSASQTLSSEQAAQPRVPTSTQLRVLGQATTVDPTKMTVVMTHGWNNKAGDWPTSMAAVLASYAYRANILAWDWESDAKIHSLNPVPSAGRTPTQGTALANALIRVITRKSISSATASERW